MSSSSHDILKLSISKARGLRVEQARAMAGYTRRALEEKYGINVNTLKSWESAKTALSTKGAIKLVAAFKDAGISCSVDWLLHGTTPPPSFYISSLCSNILTNVQAIIDPDEIMPLDEEAAIFEEIELFRRVNNDAQVFLVVDDGLAPFYEIGDFVAGKKKTENFVKYIGFNCIVETCDDRTLLRKLMSSKEAEKFNLLCTNPNTLVAEPVLYSVELKSITPISWHRRRI